MVQELVVYIIIASAALYSLYAIIKIFKQGRNRKGEYYCSGCSYGSCNIKKQ